MNEDQLHRLAVTQNSDSVGSLANHVSDAGQNPDTKRSTGDVFREMGKGFLDSLNGTLLTPLVRPLQIAANTPGWQAIQDKRAILANQRKQSDLEAARSDAAMQYVEEEAANKIISERNQLKRQELENQYNEETLPARKAFLERRLEMLDQEANQAELEKLIGTATMAANSGLNTIKEWGTLLDDKSRKYVQDSTEFREYSAFLAMKQIAPQALQELVSGKSGKAGQQLEQLAKSVGCHFELDDAGKIWLVNDVKNERYEASPENLAKYEQSALQQLQKLCQQAQAIDSGTIGGHVGGAAQGAILNDYIAASGKSLPDGLKYWSNIMKYASSDHKAYDMLTIDFALRSMQKEYAGKGIDPLKPVDVEKLSPQDQGTMMSILNTLQKRHNIQIVARPDGSEFDVYDHSMNIASKPICTAHELFQDIQRQDRFGKIIASDMAKMQEDREKKELDARVRAANRGISNAWFGDDEEINAPGQTLSQEEQDRIVSEVGKNNTLDWEDDDFKKYDELKNKLFELIKTKGFTNENDKIDLEKFKNPDNYKQIRDLYNAEQSMIKESKLKLPKGYSFVSEYLEAIKKLKQMRNELKQPPSSATRGGTKTFSPVPFPLPGTPFQQSSQMPGL